MNLNHLFIGLKKCDPQEWQLGWEISLHQQTIDFQGNKRDKLSITYK